jgi:hypothetical protein
VPGTSTSFFGSNIPKPIVALLKTQAHVMVRIRRLVTHAGGYDSHGLGLQGVFMTATTTCRPIRGNTKWSV